MAWVQGIDVSTHQGQISWDRVKGTSNKYAFIKATEGVGFEDPAFQRNWLESQRAGIPRGAYHFCLPSAAGSDDALGEANWFCDVIEKKAAGWGDLPAVADVETTKLGPIETTDWTITFCERVKARTGRAPIIYAGGAVIPGRMAVDNRLLNYKLWLPHYTAPDQVDPDPAKISRGVARKPWSDWTLWQYTERGKVAGIDGFVDRNVVDKAALDQLVSEPIVVDEPPPEPPKPRTVEMTQAVPVLRLGHGWYRPEERPAVMVLQALLNARSEQTVEVDGFFGSGTRDALKSWQTEHGISPANGVATAKTWASLIT